MRRLIITVIVLILIAASAWLSYTTYLLWHDPNTLPITRVQVEGPFRYVSRGTIEQQVLPYVQHGFLHVDVGVLRQKLLEDPSVKEVGIVRIWPDKLWIEVYEHRFVARWHETDSAQDWLVTDEGQVMSVTPTPEDAALPRLTGPALQTKPLLQLMQQIDKKLTGLNLHVIELAQDPRHAIKAKLSNDVWLFLGRESPLTRVQRFVQVYEKLTPTILGKMNYIDLRYTNGIAVKIDKL